LEIDIPRIRAGEKATETFNYTFVNASADVPDAKPEPVEVTAEVVPPETSDVDELVVDNTRLFAARVGKRCCSMAIRVPISCVPIRTTCGRPFRRAGGRNSAWPSSGSIPTKNLKRCAWTITR
jgi:hypothetical protein